VHQHSSRELIPFFAKKKGIAFAREEFGRDDSKNFLFALYLWR